MGSRKPDFKNAYISANEILVASSTQAFPINTKKIVNQWTDMAVLSFEKAEELGIDIKAFGSESAVLICKYGRYVIFYNQGEYAPRVRFSILHELGHYYLGHPLKNYEGDDDYDSYEIEANFFVAQLLMPEQVINELKTRGARITKEFLIEKFGVSDEAAAKRLETLGKYKSEWRSNDEKLFDETILFKYGSFMDAILPKKNRFNWYEDELEMQSERDKWSFDTRTRYGR